MEQVAIFRKNGFLGVGNILAAVRPFLEQNRVISLKLNASTSSSRPGGMHLPRGGIDVKMEEQAVEMNAKEGICGGADTVRKRAGPPVFEFVIAPNIRARGVDCPTKRTTPPRGVFEVGKSRKQTKSGTKAGSGWVA